MKLTAKQERFCEEYLIDLNATQAAIRAGYSKNTANEIAAQNLAKLSIQQYLSKKKEILANKLQITQEMVLEGYRKLAFYDARKFYDSEGNLISIPDLDDETAFALTGFEVMEEKGGDGQGHQVLLGYTKKIKMSDRKGALDSICKVLGFNAPDKTANTDSQGNDIPPARLTDQQFIFLIQNINEAANTR
jgi:phage terminase small subunit